MGELHSNVGTIWRQAGHRPHEDDLAARRRQVVARWVATTTNGLTSTAARSVAEEAMRQVGDEEPAWMLTYFAGVLSDLAASLPAEDPWRSMSAVIVTGRGRGHRLVRHGSTDGPLLAARQDETGAWLASGQPLTSPVSMTDLLVPATDDLDADPAFVMYVEGIDPLPAALAAFAFHSPGEVRAVLETVHESLVAEPNILGVTGRMSPLAEVTRAAQAAIRWLAFRRSAYVGNDHDDCLYVAAYSWIGKAERVSAGAPIAQESMAPAVRVWKIQDGQYSHLTALD